MARQRQRATTLQLWFRALCLAALFTIIAAASSSTNHTQSASVRDSSGSSTGEEYGHKPLWPLGTRDYLTIVLSAIGLIVASGGGIGGGGILVPLFILVLGFSPKNAVPLSNVTILGGSIANTFFSLLSRHPLADRPLVDFSMILMMEPTTIVGAVVGSFLNKLLPGVVISSLLVIVLSALAHRTLKKGIKHFNKEGGMRSLCGGEGRDEEETLFNAAEALEGSANYAATDDAEGTERALPASKSVPMVHRAVSFSGEAVAVTGGSYRAGGRVQRYDDDIPSEILALQIPTPTDFNITRVFSLASSRVLLENLDLPDDGLVEDGPEGSAEQQFPSYATNASGDAAHAPVHKAASWAPSSSSKFVHAREGVNDDNNNDNDKPAHPHLQDVSVGGTHLKRQEELRSRLIEDDRYIPIWKPLVLTLCFLGIIVLDVLKGGSGRSPLGFLCGSPWYWVTTLATIPWVALFFVFIRKAILKEYRAKAASGYPFVEGDIVWTPSSTIKFPLICVTAGLFAGVFGVGGGIVKGPLMLEMGVLPPVAAATAATMILFTSAAATVAFYVFGLIPEDYGIFFFVWGFLCTAVGQALVGRLLKKYKKESFIVLSIGGVILLSAILMAFQAITNFIQHPEAITHLPGLCGSE